MGYLELRDLESEISSDLLDIIKDGNLYGFAFWNGVEPDKHDVCFRNVLRMIFENSLVKRP